MINLGQDFSLLPEDRDACTPENCTEPLNQELPPTNQILLLSGFLDGS